MQEYEVKDAKEAAEQAKAQRLAEAKSDHEKLLAERKLLPIYPYREQLLDAVAEYQVVVIVGETGSGKTTQVSRPCNTFGEACFQGMQSFKKSEPCILLTPERPYCFEGVFRQEMKSHCMLAVDCEVKSSQAGDHRPTRLLVRLSCFYKP